MVGREGRGRELAKLGLGESVNVEALEAELKAEMRKRFMTYNPYEKQKKFHNSKALERVLSGANQSGKTYSSCMEAAIHATGLYPDWWEGHRLEPTYNEDRDEWELNIWVLATDSLTVRDSLMSKIVGTVEKDFRNGFIHRDMIKAEKRIMKSGVSGLVDQVKIRHASGHDATLFFRSYEQGRENLQSATISIVYCDEEPPEEVIGELKARLTATGGLMYMAFTPLNGMTELVQEFWRGDDEDKFLVCLSMYDAGHMTEDLLRKAEKRYASLKYSERQARMYGIPAMGAGMVYPVPDEELIGELPRDLPDYRLKWLNGMDFGRGEHPTAVVFGAYDTSTGVLYLYDAFETVEKSVAENASLIKRRGSWIPTAFPHDLLKDTGVGSGKSRSGSGHRYKDWYEEEGVTMTPEHAQLLLSNGKKSASVENGLIEVRRMMTEGRLKVSRSMSAWFDEKNIYRYDDNGKPIKKRDHMMDATRYLVVMLRYAITKLDIFEDNGEVKDETDIFA